MFTGLDFVIGNDNYGGDWALLSDPAARKAHRTYPPPTSAPRRRVHRLTQLFLHRVLLDIFSDHCPAIIADYLETSKYDDDALQDDDGHPYCVGTALLQAIERHCVPTDDESSMTVMSRFETAQALEKRLSLEASIMPYLLSYCACKRKNAALSGTVN